MESTNAFRSLETRDIGSSNGTSAPHTRKMESLTEIGVPSPITTPPRAYRLAPPRSPRRVPTSLSGGGSVFSCLPCFGSAPAQAQSHGGQAVYPATDVSPAPRGGAGSTAAGADLKTKASDIADKAKKGVEFGKKGLEIGKKVHELFKKDGKKDGASELMEKVKKGVSIGKEVHEMFTKKGDNTAGKQVEKKQDVQKFSDGKSAAGASQGTSDMLETAKKGFEAGKQVHDFFAKKDDNTGVKQVAKRQEVQKFSDEAPAQRPEQKPEQKSEQNPEQKPEQKSEQNPEQKPEQEEVDDENDDDDDNEEDDDDEEEEDDDEEDEDDQEDDDNQEDDDKNHH